MKPLSTFHLNPDTEVKNSKIWIATVCYNNGISIKTHNNSIFLNMVIRNQDFNRNLKSLTNPKNGRALKELRTGSQLPIV